MHTTNLVDFEPVRNEWFIRMRVQGKEQAVYLGVHWQDQRSEALLAAKSLLDSFCSLEYGYDNEEAVPAGLLLDAVEDFRCCISD